MAKTPAPIAEFLCDQLRDWAPVAVRPLFGGWGLYNGALMFGLIARDTVYFRTGEGNRQDYAAAGMPPFRYTMASGKTLEMAYAEVPAAVLDEPETLAEWADRAQEAALRAASAKGKRKSPAAKRRPVSRTRR